MCIVDLVGGEKIITESNADSFQTFENCRSPARKQRFLHYEIIFTQNLDKDLIEQKAKLGPIPYRNKNHQMRLSN